MSAEQRQFKRVLAQRFGGCVVKLHEPRQVTAVLVDISVGGMKILIEHSHGPGGLQQGAAVLGQLHNDNPAFHMGIQATVAWLRPTVIDNEEAFLLGLRFADYTELPEALMHLIEAYDN